MVSNGGTAGGAADPRVAGLRAAVARLRRDLACHGAPAADREAAEEQLAALDAEAAGGAPVVTRLRGSLLLVTGALGSFSALRPGVDALRDAVDLFGLPAAGRPRR
ncbi:MULTISPECIES: DUF5955 family protein [Streptomycetaceae]|uniref:DUF5955 family protein n=1 Tax=Streptomycetaceae TaxID=2062 RepID=UPI000213FB63|nr:DUF5955 family protein [Streptantibioticus cattleyicolor]CCB77472.1 conserved protein of unknown function [Streptantibioticus cattleyicolor NRRL 8057 = DSM 46488]